MQNLWTMLMVALMGVICGSVESYSAWSSPSTCPLVDIRTQDRFDAERFSGMWYLISDYDTEGQFLYGFLEIADVRAHFSVSDAGSMSILTGESISDQVINAQGTNMLVGNFTMHWSYRGFGDKIGYIYDW